MKTFLSVFRCREHPFLLLPVYLNIVGVTNVLQIRSKAKTSTKVPQIGAILGKIGIKKTGGVV
jgi:hypothetical protein